MPAVGLPFLPRHLDAQLLKTFDDATLQRFLGYAGVARHFDPDVDLSPGILLLNEPEQVWLQIARLRHIQAVDVQPHLAQASWGRDWLCYLICLK